MARSWFRGGFGPAAHRIELQRLVLGGFHSWQSVWQESSWGFDMHWSLRRCQCLCVIQKKACTVGEKSYKGWSGHGLWAGWLKSECTSGSIYSFLLP